MPSMFFIEGGKSASIDLFLQKIKSLHFFLLGAFFII